MNVLSVTSEERAIAEMPGWGEIARMAADRRLPQAMSAVLPSGCWAAFRDLYARLALCEHGTGSDGCGGCRGWASDTHPDLVIAGAFGDPPGVADCLAWQANLQLRPVAARGRLGVVCAADTMSLPAANSLLKVTEEPPADVRVLFLSETGALIPTIRSRVWTCRVASPDVALEAQAPPSEVSEWASWFERTKKSPADEVAATVESWAAWFSGQGRHDTSASLSNFIYIARKRHIPVSMVQDAMFAILREGVRVEEIFDDLREA